MLVFMYGSLMSGMYNHYIIEKEKFIGEAKTEKGFTLKPACEGATFPIMIRGGSGQVVGEVYDIKAPGPLWTRLLNMEQISGYEPEPILIVLPEGSTKAVAVAFLYAGKELGKEVKAIKSGSWREFYEPVRNDGRLRRV